MLKLRSYLILPVLLCIALWAMLATPVAAQTGQMFRVTRWTDVYAAPGGARLAGVALAPDTIVELVSSDSSGNWAQISSDRADGWVPFDALLEVGAPPVSPATTTTRWTNLFSAPGGTPTGAALPPNTQVEILSRSADGHWLQVRAAGRTGWVPANAVSGVNPDPRPMNPPAPGTPPAPTPPPAPPPAPPTDEETVTIYYASNPDEVLGVFPVRNFNARDFYGNLQRLRAGLETMKNTLDGTLRGDAGACASYIAAYEGILRSGVFYENVPAEWQEADLRYFLSFVYALDRTRPAYLSCQNAGRVDQFNYGLALDAVFDAINVVDPAIRNAQTLLGISG